MVSYRHPIDVIFCPPIQECIYQPVDGDFVNRASWLIHTHSRLNFSNQQGYLVVISTKMSDIGQEQFSGQFQQGGLTDVAYSSILGHAAVAGPSGIKVRLLLDHPYREFRQVNRRRCCK